jgi:hypothetical protein
MSSLEYIPPLASVRQHPPPSWYQDAKFGIFIHWTISSVPAYAPTGLGDISQIFAKKSQADAFTHNAEMPQTYVWEFCLLDKAGNT